MTDWLQISALITSCSSSSRSFLLGCASSSNKGLWVKKGLWHELGAITAQTPPWILPSSQPKGCPRALLCSTMTIFTLHHSQHNLTVFVLNLSGKSQRCSASHREENPRSHLDWGQGTQPQQSKQKTALMQKMQWSQLTVAWHPPEGKAGLLKATHPASLVSTQWNGLTDTRRHFSMWG